VKQKEERDLLGLRQAGFGAFEVRRLCLLRHRYAAERDERERLAEYRRLLFMRWLVATGKLTEQVTQANA
jgi:hypothetical protein